MKKQVIKLGVDARIELAEGAKFLANAVTRTLGPFGENAFLEKKNKITNDGVTIAREITSQNEIQNRGITALREASIKTNDQAGDGTTTAITLAWEIYQAASRFLGKKDVIGQKTPSELVKQIEKERKEVTEKLIAMATPIETKEQLIQSARVSVEDSLMGEIIGSAQWDIGKEGYLIAETTNERTSFFEKVSGIRIDNGAGTSNVFNNVEKQLLELKDVPVILTSYTIRDFVAIEKTLNQLLRSGKREIVIIARAWTEEGIRTCQENHSKGFAIYPLNAPYYDMRSRFQDLSAVTGAKFYDSEGSDLSELSIQDVGFIKSLKAGRYDALIAGNDDILTNDRIAKRADELQKQYDGSESEFEKKNLNERISQLKGGFGIIKVGSTSDMERERLYDKCEDAVNAVRAAFQEGTVKGGGLAFKEISESLPDGYILKRPLLAIYEQIMSSAPDGFVIEDWVRDPVKVLRIALENACASASTFATAGIAIAQEVPKGLNELFQKQIADDSE